MRVVVAASHLGVALEGPLPVLAADAHEVGVAPDAREGWDAVAAVCEPVADAVAAADGPVAVVAGDCTTSLGVLAGLQRRHDAVGVVWLDAHPDAHTRASSRSGYLGGMPLGIACVELRPPAALRGLGLRPLSPRALRFVDVRDADPGEADLVARAGTVGLDDLAAGDGLPDGPLYVHLDVDVLDSDALPGLRYPVPGGPSADAVLDALRGVVGTGRVAALGLSLSWRPEVPDDGRRAALARDLGALVAA